MVLSPAGIIINCSDNFLMYQKHIKIGYLKGFMVTPSVKVPGIHKGSQSIFG